MENERELINTFTEPQLRRLHCTDDEVALVMEYQRLLPILCKENEIEKFCVDARTLYEQLGGSQNRNFSHWVKSNLRIFKEDEDYIKISSQTAKNGVFVFKDVKSSFCPVGQKPKGGRPQQNFVLTLDTAKEIAMFTGLMANASKELQHRSRLTRKYFILMEKLVKDNNFWEIVRLAERKNYKPMDACISRIYSES